MNFLDSYEASSTPPPAQPEQSLNEEVNQVVGQLGRFWGGFRKRSQSAIESARKDFGSVVVQAQKELSKYAQPEGAPKDPSIEEKDEASNELIAGSSSERATSANTGDETPAAPTSPVRALFARIQSSIPPNVVSTVQGAIPESIKQASGNVDFDKIRTTVSSEFVRLQGVTKAQAEEYSRVGGALLKEASEVLKEAVKVVPPEQSGAGSGGLVWDGTDMWMLPGEVSDTAAVNVKGKERETGSASADAQRAVATRAEALLKRLKHDPEILRHDPQKDGGAKVLYASWLEDQVDEGEGGLESEEWQRLIHKILRDGPDGEALKDTQDTLVPSEMTRDTFWKRYFFRVHQIESEEAKRKALLQGPVQSEEDFSWGDDEDEATPAAETKATPKTVTKSDADNSLSGSVSTLEPKKLEKAVPSASVGVNSTKPIVPTSPSQTPSATSPRQSSEESYDLLSSSNVSSNAEKEAKEEEEEDDDDDEDEEEEEEEETDEAETGEAGSDGSDWE